MTCIIVEDQPPARRILKQYIGDLDHLQLVGEFPDALQATSFLQERSVDLMFLDIHLPKLSGIDFLKSLSHPPRVILTTAFPDFALEGYELDVVDYLLKPFSFTRFVKAVLKVSTPAPTEPTGPRELFIKSGYEHLKIAVADIRFIRSDADYTELHLPQRKLLSPEPLRHWLETLDPQRFVQVHRSYIVNLDHLVKVTGGQIYLSGDAVVPIGRAYREEFMKLIL